MTAFEDGLWTRLVDQHGADRASLPGQRSRMAVRPMVGAGVAAILAAVAVAVGVIVSSAPAAYALTRNANGTITLSIYRWSRVNIHQINARFAQLGSRWRVVRVSASCASVWPPKDYGYEIDSTTVSGAQSGSVTPGPTTAAFPGVWLIAAGRLADGRMAMTTVTMPGPMPSCLPPAALQPPS